MNTWRHVAHISSEVHEALMGWARALLQEAGLETIEVYGQFPPVGTVSQHIVLFPYRVHPEPKVAENAPGASLLGTQERVGERGSFVPPVWVELGRALSLALEVMFPDAGPVFGNRRPGQGPGLPLLSALPPAIQSWYESVSPQADEESWTLTFDGELYVRPPSLWWHPPITITTRYIVVSGEPGRGTAERTSTGAPMALPALSVLATGLHLERVLHVRLPPLPFPAQLTGYVEALASALEQGFSWRSDEGTAGHASRLRSALDGIQRPDLYPVSVLPIHDLSNHEFALIMQALQRPLQPALNLCVRLPLGAVPVFGPGTASNVRIRPPLQGESPRSG